MSTLVNTAVDATEAAISQLHIVTGTPWYITIPLLALGVNLMVRIPFGIYTQKMAQKRDRLNEMLWTWGALHGMRVRMEWRNEARRQAKLNLPRPKLDAAAERLEATKRLEKTTARLYKKFGVQEWKLWSNILSLPPWLVVIEALRRMSGAPAGLLGLIFRSGGNPADGAMGGAASTAAATAGLPIDEITAGPVTSAAGTVSDAMPLVHLPTDPSLATGGIFWFTDLTVPDPYYILPFALSALLFANILPPTDAGRRALFGLDMSKGMSPPVTAKGARLRGIQRSLLILSLVVGPATLHFPCSIHLYWICSSMSSFLITRGLRSVFPVAKRPSSTPQDDLAWVVPSGPSTTTTPKK